MSVITLITIAGVAVGVAALIIVISVISGFQDVVQAKHLEAFSHLVITSNQPYIEEYPELIEKVKQFDGVKAVSPFVLGQVMLASETSVAGAVLRGVNPEMVGQVTSLVDNLKLGKVKSIEQDHATPYKISDTKDIEPIRYPGILLGDELAASLHVVLGSELRVISPLGESTPVGVIPKMSRFIVTGIFSTGLYTFDAQFAFISMAQAQVFFNLPDAITGLEIKLDDLWKAREVGLMIQSSLGWPYRSLPWMDMNRSLFSAMKLEKVVMFIIVSLISLVAAMNIFSTIYMMVMEKQRSIAILKTMGASNRRIVRMFVAPGIYIAFIGSVFGFALGISLCLIQIKFGIVRLDPTVYMFEQLPMKFKLFDFILITAAAFTFSFLATIFPARIAAKLDPVKVLRYE